MFRRPDFAPVSRCATIVAVIMMLSASVSLANEGASSYVLTVGGLSCPFCTYGVEKELYRIEGVDVIDIALDTGSVVVTMRDGTVLDEADANNAVEAAGFSLDAFERLSVNQ